MMCKPLPTFSDMPWHIKDKIVDFSSYNSRLRIRKCSKELRKLVDKSQFHFEKLAIYLDLSDTIICYDDTYSVYSVHGDNGCTVSRMIPEEIDGKKFVENHRELLNSKVLEKENYIKQAIADFATFIKSSKCSSKTFELYFLPFSNDREYCTEQFVQKKRLVLSALEKTLECREQKLAVHELYCCFPVTQHEVLQVLAHLQPGTLCEISLQNENGEFDEVYATEQWKKATVAEMRHPGAQLDQFLNFHGINIREYALRPEEMIELIKSGMRFAQYELNYFVSFPAGYDKRPCYAVMKDWPNPAEQNFEMYNYRVLKIPGTPYHLMMKLRSCGFWLQRVDSASWNLE